MAKPAAAATATAAAAHFTHRRTLYPETESNWGSKSEVQDDSIHIAEADQATRKLRHTTSDMNVDTHLSEKEVSTDALLKKAVKEELTDTNTKAVERNKTDSNKNGIRDDLAKEKMVVSQESSQATFEMGNVEPH